MKQCPYIKYCFDEAKIESDCDNYIGCAIYNMCNRVIDNVKDINIGVDWKKDLGIYRNMVKSEFKKCYNDTEWMSFIKEDFKALDIEKTFRKIYDFWVSDKGWYNKKVRKSNPNWKLTIRTAFKDRRNQVFKEQKKERKLVV